MLRGASLTALFLVIEALLFDKGDLPWPGAIALGCIALIPWIPRVQDRMGLPLFAILELAPVAVLALTGASPLILALLALATAYVAVYERMPLSLGFALLAQCVLFARMAMIGEANWFVWKSYIEIGLALGWAVRAQRLLVLRSEQSVHERSLLAAVEERRRIARDVHDVIAHSLSVTLLHLNSARMLLEDDPEAAAQVLDEAAKHGRESLGEVRQAVGLLSEPARIELPGDPTAAAAAVEALVADYRDAGLDVELHLDVAMEHMGLLAQTPTGVWATGYRIVQESLANVVKHAPGMPAEITVRVGDDNLHIDIFNPLPTDLVVLDVEGGYGLRGMRERAEMLGGRVTVGSELVRKRRQFHVHAQIPLDITRAASRSANTTLGKTALGRIS